jgi:hypothetical protein
MLRRKIDRKLWGLQSLSFAQEKSKRPARIQITRQNNPAINNNQLRPQQTPKICKNLQPQQIPVIQN